MGIRTGVSNLLTCLKYGLYNKNCRSYAICVDGEFMRYKGLLDINLACVNAEIEVARSAVNYLKKKVLNVEQFMDNKQSQYVVVYMDGERVKNKETRPEFNFELDMKLWRLTFIQMCRAEKYRVVELSEGEAELQMYLQRDTTMDLNIFITNDSDMLAICYGHQPIITQKSNKKNSNNNNNSVIVANDNEQNAAAAADDDASMASDITYIEFDILNHCVSRSSNVNDDSYTNNLQDFNNYISDFNYQYPPYVEVQDSCLWINTSKNITRAYGFDASHLRLGFSKNVFLALIAFCGTDYTNSLLTNTLLDGVLLADDDEKQFLNTFDEVEDDPNTLGAIFMYLGIRHKGVIKRITPDTCNADNYIENLPKVISIYREYITTGVMRDEPMPRYNMALVARDFLYGMQLGRYGDDFSRKTMLRWIDSCSIPDAIDNYKSFAGRYLQFLKRQSQNK